MDTAAQISVYRLPLLHASGALFALHALCHPHSPQGTIAWILGLTLLPLITLPLYLILGAVRILRHTTSRPAANHAQGRKLSGSGIFALLVGMNRI
jgi:hypothetical protein